MNESAASGIVIARGVISSAHLSAAYRGTRARITHTCNDAHPHTCPVNTDARDSTCVREATHVHALSPIAKSRVWSAGREGENGRTPRTDCGRREWASRKEIAPLAWAEYRNNWAAKRNEGRRDDGTSRWLVFIFTLRRDGLNIAKRCRSVNW